MRDQAEHLCVCGHSSADHDPWPICTHLDDPDDLDSECPCIEYEGRIPESRLKR